MKKSEMEKEMRALLQRRGAYLVLPADITLEGAARLGPSRLLDALVEDRKPKEGWEPEEEPLPDRLQAVSMKGLDRSGQGFDATLQPGDGEGWGTPERELRGYEAAVEAYNRIQVAGGPHASVVVNRDLYNELCKQVATTQPHRPSPEVVAAFESLKKFFESII